AGHVRDFGEILTDRLGSTLPTWIDAVDASQLLRFSGCRRVVTVHDPCGMPVVCVIRRVGA
ncbi:hypothetical protein, partial [Streptomyces rishiriensis]|uniref:hypothetical protein n=1 Tax=Streptomyces rishiriensis TaxID=68264 RepID=UPI0037D87354